jgi:hypothetical protein
LQRLDRSTPSSPTKPVARASSRAPPSRPPSVARSVPPVRNEPRIVTATFTNPHSPSRIRRPLGTMSAQAASVRQVPESPSPTKPISLEHAHLKMRQPPPRIGGNLSPVGRSQSQTQFAMPAPRMQAPASPTRSIASNSSTSSMMAANSSMMNGFRSMPNMNSPHRNFSGGSDAPSITSQSENWETYDEGSEPEEEFDTPRAMRRLGGNGPFNGNAVMGGTYGSPSRQRRSGSMSSTVSGKARVYIQQQSQRGQDLIAELMEEVQEVDDEWGDEGF